MQIRSLHFVIALVAGWLQREQGAVLEYLREENKLLREQLAEKRILFTDAQAVVSLDGVRLLVVVAFASSDAS